MTLIDLSRNTDSIVCSVLVLFRIFSFLSALLFFDFLYLFDSEPLSILHMMIEIEPLLLLWVTFSHTYKHSSEVHFSFIYTDSILYFNKHLPFFFCSRCTAISFAPSISFLIVFMKLLDDFSSTLDARHRKNSFFLVLIFTNKFQPQSHSN